MKALTKIVIVGIMLAINGIANTSAQSLCLDLTVHGDNPLQYGISAEHVIGSFGAYYNRIVKETHNADYEMHDSVDNINGYIIGLIFTMNKSERFDFISVGIGSYNHERYCTTGLLNGTYTMLFEIRTAIKITKEINILIGFDSKPMITSGVQFKLNMN